MKPFTALPSKSLLCLTSICLFAPLHLTANHQWPGFRGASNGISSHVIGPEIQKAKLQPLWKVDTPTGFSSFCVGDLYAYTIIKDEIEGNPTEVLVAYQLDTGNQVWSSPLSIITKYDGGGDDGASGNKGGDGPRSTPAYSDGIVYVTDANTVLHAIDAKTGKSLWHYDVLKKHNGNTIRWQNAASPVIDGNVVLLGGGGAGQALLGIDKKSGKNLWATQDDIITHATPVIADIHGVRQCIFYTQKGLVSLSPQDGKLLWRAEFPFKISSAASPIVYEDIVYCSAGYGVGAGAFKISKQGSEFQSQMLWRRENECFNHWSTPVVKDGYLYGMFGFKAYANGPVACVDIRTGKDQWQEAGFGPGQVILSGSTLVALSDQGDVVFIEAQPKAYRELKREKILEGKVWSYPVLTAGHLLARSTIEGGCWKIQTP